VLADTQFLIELAREIAANRRGLAHAWIVSNRHQRLWMSVISLGELAAGFRDNHAARQFIERSRYRVAALKPEIAYRAAALDRELIRAGNRLGENDNWIAAFALYYGESLLSNDDDFDRVPGLRRVSF
jgi:predicted nucleic acid-binding protein